MALGIEITLTGESFRSGWSGPAMALGIEMSVALTNVGFPGSGPAMALGIEMARMSIPRPICLVGACEGPGD